MLTPGHTVAGFRVPRGVPSVCCNPARGMGVQVGPAAGAKRGNRVLYGCEGKPPEKPEPQPVYAEPCPYCGAMQTDLGRHLARGCPGMRPTPKEQKS